MSIANVQEYLKLLPIQKWMCSASCSVTHLTIKFRKGRMAENGALEHSVAERTKIWPLG